MRTKGGSFIYSGDMDSMACMQVDWNFGSVFEYYLSEG